MGVPRCSREGCENILCDRYSHNYGYICPQCFKELVSLGPHTAIYEFMRSVKGTGTAEEAYEKFDGEFPIS